MSYHGRSPTATFSSRTLYRFPIRITFVNADPRAGRYRTLFKCGDDLRQDLLTLQVLSVMERIWLDRGLTPCMTPYECVSVGNQLGWIAWVEQSETTAQLQHNYGGRLGAFSNKNIEGYIKDKGEWLGSKVATATTSVYYYL